MSTSWRHYCLVVTTSLVGIEAYLKPLLDYGGPAPGCITQVHVEPKLCPHLDGKPQPPRYSPKGRNQRPERK